jgi:hypothetical protein
MDLAVVRHRKLNFVQDHVIVDRLVAARADARVEMIINRRTGRQVNDQGSPQPRSAARVEIRR